VRICHGGCGCGAYHDLKRALEINPKFELAKEQLTRSTVTVGAK
jgi:hypothetical protein